MGCYNDFANKHADAMRRIAPRTEPLETPIEDPKKTEHETSWGHKWTHTEIKKIDTSSNIG